MCSWLYVVHIEYEQLCKRKVENYFGVSHMSVFSK